jgi:hypothetical protein
LRERLSFSYATYFVAQNTNSVGVSIDQGLLSSIQFQSFPIFLNLPDAYFEAKMKTNGDQQSSHFRQF